jgi:hypothetical protein
MSKKWLLFGLIIMSFGCNSNSVEKPKNLIEKDKMVAILYDISLLEAIKTQNINGGITSEMGFDYIYKKYKIDSVQFSKSNKYYASDIDEYKKIGFTSYTPIDLPNMCGKFFNEIFHPNQIKIRIHRF